MAEKPLSDYTENLPLARSCGPCNVLDCATGQNLSPLACSELMPAVKQQAFTVGELLLLKNLSVDTITVVAVGVVRLEWILDDGRRQVIGFRFRGDILHRPCEIRAIRAVAVTDGILYRVGRETIGRCRAKMQGLDFWEFSAVQEYLTEMTTRTMLLSRFSAKERLVYFLAELAWRTGEKTKRGTEVTLAMNREDIADYLALNPETVSRQFSALKSAGLIHLPKPGMAIIPDLEGLAAIAPLKFSGAVSSDFLDDEVFVA